MTVPDGAKSFPQWEGRRVLVAGFGVSGFAIADTLVHIGASVHVVDDRELDGGRAEQAELLEFLGATFTTGPGSSASVDVDVDLVVASPGWPPHATLFERARERGIEIMGELELAWQLRLDTTTPWLVVTGTNGKTTTVQMLASMLQADGRKVALVGNVGRPILEAIFDEEEYDVYVLELSSFQLHWPTQMAPAASVVLNVADDHLDWHGGFDRYADDKARIYENTQIACVYNEQDERTRTMVENADVAKGCRAIGFTLGMPAVSMVGLVDDVLADRAFVEERQTSAAELGTLADLPDASPHNVANALAAAAMARAIGVTPTAVREGIRSFRLAPHRIAVVGSVNGVTMINDSKATNVHAALASLRGRSNVIWIAGGLAKGASFDDLARQAAGHLKAAVIIGTDRELIAGALAAEAPDVPVVRVDSSSDVMEEAVAAALGLSAPGDTVLLAPGCASMDQFASYEQRGEAFAAAVKARM